MIDKAKATEYHNLLVEASKAPEEIRKSFCKGMKAAYMWQELQEEMSPEELYKYCEVVGLGESEKVKKLGEHLEKKNARKERLKAQVWWKPQTWVLW